MVKSRNGSRLPAPVPDPAPAGPETALRLFTSVDRVQQVVRVNFTHAVNWMDLTPDQARRFAQDLLAHADSLNR